MPREVRDGLWAWGEAVSSAPCKLLLFCHILHYIKPSFLSLERWGTAFEFRGQTRDPHLSPWAPRSPWASCWGLLSCRRAQQGPLCWASVSLPDPSTVYSGNMAGGPASREVEGRAPPPHGVVPCPDLGLLRFPASCNSAYLPCPGAFLSLSLHLSPPLGLWDRSLHEATPSRVSLELGG